MNGKIKKAIIKKFGNITAFANEYCNRNYKLWIASLDSDIKRHNGKLGPIGYELKIIKKNQYELREGNKN